MMCFPHVRHLISHVYATYMCVSTVPFPYPWGICSKTTSECHKPQIVKSPIYTVFSYTYANV
jgi:hypothetical protein